MREISPCIKFNRAELSCTVDLPVVQIRYLSTRLAYIRCDSNPFNNKEAIVHQYK